MSKSLGNFTTIRDLLDGNWSEYPQPIDPMAIRLLVLQAHYRKPLDFTKAAIIAAENAWQTLKEVLLLSHECGMKGKREGGKEWRNEEVKESITPLPHPLFTPSPMTHHCLPMTTSPVSKRQRMMI